MFGLTESERRNDFFRFLGSSKAKQAILDVLTNQERGSILRSFETQLRDLSHTAMAQFSAHVEKALDAARGQFILFLRSDDGKRLLVDLLIEALARNDLAPVLNSAETRLKDLAAEELATFAAHAEMSLKASSAAHADALIQNARQAAQDITDRVHQDVQDHLSSYRAKIAEAVRERLPILLQEEIARHVRSGPCLSPGRSNRELALAYGISIREVKRRRLFGDSLKGLRLSEEAAPETKGPVSRGGA